MQSKKFKMMVFFLLKIRIWSFRFFKIGKKCHENSTEMIYKYNTINGESVQSR